MVDGNGQFAPELLSRLPQNFFEANDVARTAVGAELNRALDGYQVGQRHPALISIEEIDTFRQAAEIPSGDVTAISHPLQLPERDVKRLVAGIIGESSVPKDWGGESDDLYSTRVRVGGRPTPTSFIFKGPAKAGALTLAALGKNGDQLDRMLNQEARLYVVQHCDVVDPSVRRHLARGIIALRAAGKEDAVGSVWDGNDCARLFVAHGLLDRGTGKLRT